MAEVRPATAAMNLGARHAETAIRRRAQCAGERIEETGPARAAVELFPGPKQRLVAAGAQKISGALFVIQGAAARSFSPVAAHHIVLLGR